MKFLLSWLVPWKYDRLNLENEYLVSCVIWNYSYKRVTLIFLLKKWSNFHISIQNGHWCRDFVYANSTLYHFKYLTRSYKITNGKFILVLLIVKTSFSQSCSQIHYPSPETFFSPNDQLVIYWLSIFVNLQIPSQILDKQ